MIAFRRQCRWTDGEIVRLRALVKAAYKEGLEYGSYKYLEIRHNPMAGWEESKTKKGLEK